MVAKIAPRRGAGLWRCSVVEAETESNRRLIQEHYERQARGDWRGAAEQFAVDARNFGRPAGRQQIIRVMEDIYTTFPDWKLVRRAYGRASDRPEGAREYDEAC
jgi:hypothetical protein